MDNTKQLGENLSKDIHCEQATVTDHHNMHGRGCHQFQMADFSDDLGLYFKTIAKVKRCRWVILTYFNTNNTEPQCLVPIILLMATQKL